MELKPIEQQVVVVVGASSGMGRETALRFAERGAKVVAAARNEHGLETLAGEIRQQGGFITTVVADVAEFDKVKAIADRAISEYGRIDSWVHVAGVGVYSPFEKIKPEEFKRVIEVNLLGVVYGAMAAIPLLKRNGGGSFIAVSSVEGKRAIPLQSPYSASKHGVVGFLEALRVELAKEGAPINVVNVMPSAINTPFFSKALTKLDVKPLPYPPVYEPQVVADLLLYAAEHPVRDLFAGGGGKFFAVMQRISPYLGDIFLQLTAWRLQKTTEPKSENDPNALFDPIPGETRIRGEFSKMATPRSLYNWWETHPIVKRSTLAGTALGALAALGARNRGK
jgi:NAD(P)-dependent dehydrogenase (short-subunit alcohol dehydrogenase family)